MSVRPIVGAPVPHVLTDNDGKVAAEVSTTPPATGTDYGLRVHADLGSAPIAVDQVLTGAAFFTPGQQVLNASTATLLMAARPTRRCALVTNSDATITIYVGNAGVTASTGQPIKAGNSLTMPITGAIYAIAASGTPTAGFSEAYD
jgi:hypothetical protein